MPNLKADSFLDLLGRSGLVAKDQVDSVLSELEQEQAGRPIEDSKIVAERFAAKGLLTSWQIGKLLEGRHKGFFLGKYKLLDHLGTGGMSSVYLAEHLLMKRRVAIKVLPHNRIEDSSYLERFYREAEAAARLDHPNIVHAYDVDHDGKIHYLIMEYVEGHDLAEHVRLHGPLPFEDAALYIAQAADGLAHAHQAGLIHRDIKPANLLLDLKGTVKILDMGLAFITADDQGPSLTIAYQESVLGTADYLPPEQAVNSHNVDARADIYSLGCTLYFLLTANPPFPEGTLAQRLIAHQTQEPKSLLQYRPNAPKELVAICRRMMAKKAERRFQTAEEVARALRSWLASRDQLAEEFDAGQGEPDSASSSIIRRQADVQARQAAGSADRHSSVTRRAGSDEADKLAPDSASEAKSPPGTRPAAAQARPGSSVRTRAPVSPGSGDSQRRVGTGSSPGTPKGPGTRPSSGTKHPTTAASAAPADAVEELLPPPGLAAQVLAQMQSNSAVTESNPTLKPLVWQSKKRKSQPSVTRTIVVGAVLGALALISMLAFIFMRG